MKTGCRELIPAACLFYVVTPPVLPFNKGEVPEKIPSLKIKRGKGEL